MDFKKLKINDEVFLIKRGMYMNPIVVKGIITYKGTKKLKINLGDIEYSLTKDKLSFDSFCKDSFYTLCESEKEAYKILEDEKMKDDLISYIKKSLNDLTIEQLQSLNNYLKF